jgi:hypothetical protein
MNAQGGCMVGMKLSLTYNMLYGFFGRQSVTTLYFEEVWFISREFDPEAYSVVTTSTSSGRERYQHDQVGGGPGEKPRPALNLELVWQAVRETSTLCVAYIQDTFVRLCDK